MAETLSKILSANPFAISDSPTGQSPSQSPSRDAASRLQSQLKHVSASVEDTKTRALRILTTNGHLPDAPITTASGLDDAGAGQLPASVDPLSRYIIQRTGSIAPPPNSARRLSEHAPPNVAAAERSVLKAQIDHSKDQEVDPNTKDKKKGVSFRTLRRLIVNKKEDHFEEPVLDKNEVADGRPEGAEAEVFLQASDNVGYNPRHPLPPAYIKVRSSGKKEKDFNRLFVAQELLAETPQGMARTGSTLSSNRIRRTRPQTGEATWSMEFSLDGRYLATAGQDRIVRVWGVLASPEERSRHEKDEEADDGGAAGHLSAPVFRKRPIRTYEGHSAPVLALSWSKNNFLLSSSMDKTVRLWHVSRPECLCAFKHHDYVTSIQFHPKDDRFFLAGSLDAKLRLWSIPDKSVAFWNQLPEMITAVAFTPDGKTVITGCLSGLCLFYDTEGLRYQTQMHVRSAHGKNSKGSKITGIQTINIPPSDPSGEVKLLITSNDSRVRLYNFRDKSLEAKFKGNENSSSQIHARFSDDARYIICGSEDARVFIWDINSPDYDRKSKARVEAFEAHNAATTVSLFAPTRTRHLLSNSEDPLYDLCNPPPVTLLSKAERESLHSSRAPSEKENIYSPTSSIHRRYEDNPAYLTRCNHHDGQIIVTGDAAGVVKVFRQDCAYEKRQAWDAGSTYSSKRFGVGGTLVGRSRQSSNATQPPGERILSWQQEVMRKGSMTSSINGNGSGFNVAATGLKTGVAGGGAESPIKQISRFPSTHSSNIGNVPLTLAQQNSQQQIPSAAAAQRARPSIMVPPSPPAIMGPDGKRIDTQPTSPAAPSDLPAEVTPAPRRNSNEYWERSAWREDIIQQLQQPPRDTSRHNGNAGTGGSSDASSRRSSAGGLAVGPPHASGTGSRSASPNGLLGLPELEQGPSNVSRLTDEVSSVEPSDAEDNGGAARAGAGGGGMGAFGEERSGRGKGRAESGGRRIKGR